MAPFQHTDTCVSFYIAALFTARRNQPRRPSTDKEIVKTWYIDTVQFYSAIKKNETMKYTSKCMELENVN